MPRTPPILATLVVPGLLAISACDLTWTPDDKIYAPPPATQITVDGFGIDDVVDVLADGGFPITITRTITNAGSVAVPAGYEVTEKVERLRFTAINPTFYAWQKVPDPRFTVLECTTTGPALAPGQSADISFTFPSPECRAPQGRPTPPGFDCGMHLETLTADAAGIVTEISEGNNDTEHFFFVPSRQGRLNMTHTVDPGGDPNIDVIPAPRPPSARIAAFNYGNVPSVARPHAVRFFFAGAPGGFILNGISPVNGRLSGAVGRLSIGPNPVVFPPPAAPQTVTFDITFDPTFLGPENAPPFHAEALDSKVTAISTDGCQIRQRRLRTTLLFEARP